MGYVYICTWKQHQENLENVKLALKTCWNYMFKFYIESAESLPFIYFVLNTHSDFLFELESGPE